MEITDNVGAIPDGATRIQARLASSAGVRDEKR
jgi:hypothetical protein